MDNTIDTLQIEIRASTTDAQRGLTKLKNSLKKLAELSEAAAKMSGDGIEKLKTMSQSISSLADSGNDPGLRTAISELRKLAKIDFSGLGAGSEKISEIADKVKKIKKIKDADKTPDASSPTEKIPAGTDVDNTDSLNKTQEALENIKKKATKVKDVYSQMAAEMVKNSDKVDILKRQLDGLKEKLSRALSSQGTSKAVSQDTIANYISRIQRLQAELKKARKESNLFYRAITSIKKAVAAIKKVGDAVKNASGKMKKFGNYIGGKLDNAVGGAAKKFAGFTRSFGRIAMYRAVRFVLSQISNAFKEGTNNCYQYSKAIGGKLASSMDRIASSFLYVKNSIGAMVAPLINAVAPAIEYVADKAVDLINVLNQLFAKLSGASSWTKAVKTQTEYAEAAGNAADAAKNLTAGFDELNVLSDSGGRGGADGMDYGSMFEEVPLDGGFAKWTDPIKEAIANGDWSSVGQVLGEKIDGLIGGIDLAAIGTKLGSGINAIFETVHTTISAVDFENIGAGISGLLSNAFAEIDFNTVGATFAQKWTILADTIYGFVTTFDWSGLGLAVSDFISGWFEEIDLTKVVQTLQELARGIFESLSQAISNVEWYKIGAEIMDAIESIDWVSLLGDLGTFLSDAVAGLLDLLLGMVGETDWSRAVQDIFDGIGNLIANIEWGEVLGKVGALVAELVVQLPGIIVGALGGIADILGDLFESFGLDSVAGFFHGIGEKMRSVGTWLKENLVDPVVDWVKDLFGIHSPSTVFAEIGTFLTDGLLQGIADTWHGITEFFSEKLEDIKGFFSTAWENIKTNAGSKWNSIKTSLSSKWDDIKSGATGTFTSMKNSITGIWDGLWGALKRTINSIIGGVEKMANGVINGINAMIKTLNRLSFDIPDWVPVLGGKKFGFDLRTVSTISIPRLASGGFPDAGELFIAREAGAEMVGSIGGRTAVANNDQIVEGIKQGVREAMAESGGTHGGSFDIKVYLDGREVTAAVEKRQRERGATIYPGGVLDGV